LTATINDRPVARGLSALISVSVASQAIVFLASPFLTRLFEPVEFAQLANYVAWVSVLGLLSNLRYEHAIFVARGRAEMNRIIALALALSGASAVVYSAAAIALYLRPPHGGYFATMRPYVLFIPCGVVGIVVLSLLVHFHVRRGSIALVAKMAAVDVIATAAAQLLLGHLHVRQGLVAGALIGTITAATVFLAVHLRRHSIRHVARESAIATLVMTAREHRHFPRYLLAADVVALLSLRLVPVGLTAAFNAQVAGLYALAARTVRTPMIAIGDSVLTILRKPGAEVAQNRTEMLRLFWRAVTGLALSGVVPLVVVATTGPALFSWVFGSQWAEAGRIARVLAPGMFMELIALPLVALLVATHNQRALFVLQMLNLVMLLVAFAVGTRAGQGFMMTCVLISTAMVLANAAAVLVAYTLLRRSQPAAA
jgi:O-antigen/teichoic acid export membrane protein